MLKVRHFQKIQEGVWLPHSADLGFSLNKTKLTLVPVIYLIKTDKHSGVSDLGWASLEESKEEKKTVSLRESPRLTIFN